MATKFWIADTFSRVPLGGTPASVIFVEDFDDEILLQNIAMELNVPETVFIKNFGSSEYDFELLCFCPSMKGMYFGNCLFAASHIIREQKLTNSRNFNLILSDRVFAVNIDDDERIRIRFSSIRIKKVPLPETMHSAIDGEIIVSAAESKGSLIIEVRSPKKLSNINPNIGLINNLDYTTVILTSDTHYEQDLDYDFCARVFTPKLGFVESHVNPLAHLRLASYWSNRMEKQSMRGFQDSLRSGYVDIEYDDEYTYISGNCITATSGDLFV